MNDDDIIKRVTLLGIFKKEPNETLKDVMLMLVDTGMYELKEAKQIVKFLTAAHYISKDDGLTMKGILEAKSAEEMFKQ